MLRKKYGRSEDVDVSLTVDKSSALIAYRNVIMATAGRQARRPAKHIDVIAGAWDPRHM